MTLISDSTITTIRVPMILDSELMEEHFEDYDRDQVNGVTIIRDEDKVNAYSNLKIVIGKMRAEDPTNNYLNRLNSEIAQIIAKDW